MDIYCPKCAEPWDLDTLHEEVSDGQYRTFDNARKAFARKGCEAISFAQCSNNKANPIIGEVYDLLGDDIDGAASLLDDAERWGLF